MGSLMQSNLTVTKLRLLVSHIEATPLSGGGFRIDAISEGIRAQKVDVVPTSAL